MKTTISKRAIYAATLALALPFGLAACSDDEADDEEIVETVEEETTDNDEPVIEETPDSDTEVDTDDPVDTDEDDVVPTEDEEVAPTEDEDTNNSASGDKPSRDEVRDGIEVMLGAQLASMGITAEQIEAAGLGPALDNFYGCVVDGLYDDVSAETLEKVAAGDPDAPVMGQDYTTLTTVSESCVASELEPAMP